jgi:hypothetical protein
MREIIMTFLLCAREDEIGQRLRERIHGLKRDHDMESFATIDKLIQRLRQPVNGFLMAVILAGNRGELRKILEVGDFLGSVRIIIILPDRNPETISAALKLHPRYMSYADGDFLDVSMVARRMLQRFHSAAV